MSAASKTARERSMEIIKVSGHTQSPTFARYVNPTTDTVRHIAETLSNYVANGASEIANKGSILVISLKVRYATEQICCQP